MEDVDRANEAMDADGIGGVAEPEPEQHRDDENDSSDDDEEEDDEEEEEEEEATIPTPEEVELEYTYPQDFVGRNWEDVVAAGQYFRLIIDPACIDIREFEFVPCQYLIEIVYPEGKDSKLLHIGCRAFGECCNLQRMNPFPDGLVELGDSAFGLCSKLQGRITIPSSIQFVRESCFSCCESITSVIFESSAAANTTVVELEDGTFAYCKELRSVRLPNNLTVIPGGCFMGCHLLIDVPIPGRVRTIQDFAFAYCLALSVVDLPESVIAIDKYAYHNCSVLARVTIRSSTNAVQVGRDVFEGCPLLTTIRVVNPLIWSQLLSAMNTDPSFLYRFVRKYENQIMTDHRSSR